MRAVAAFPGQGCQKLGMGRDFYDAFAEARAVFEEASQGCGLDMAALCFEDGERLALTEFQQPAILTVEIAILRCLEQHFDLQFSRWGGHSLGEYAALVAAGALPLGAAVGLVRERGRLMQQAVPAGQGAMAAVIGKADVAIDHDAVAAIASATGVDLANDNAPDQVVLSGASDAVDRACQAIADSQALGKTRTIRLRVSAPFHSQSMKPIAAPFRALLQADCQGWSPERATQVTSNVSGGLHAGSAETIADALTEQISATVRWRDNMTLLADPGFPIFEIGPGRPLRGFFAASGHSCRSISTLEQAQAETLER